MDNTETRDFQQLHLSQIQDGTTLDELHDKDVRATQIFVNSGHDAGIPCLRQQCLGRGLILLELAIVRISTVQLLLVIN